MKKQLYVWFTTIILLLTASIWWEYFRLRIPKVFAMSLFLVLLFLYRRFSRYFVTKYFLMTLVASGVFVIAAMNSLSGLFATWSVIVPQTLLLPFACAGIFAYVLVKSDYKLLKIVLVLTVAFVVYTAIKTSAAEVNSARVFIGNALTQEMTFKAQENLENTLMGYAQIHSIPLIMVGVVCMFKKSEVIWIKYLVAFVGVVCLYALVKSGYAAATLATGLAVLMALISLKRRGISLFLMILGIVVVGVMVQSGFLLFVLEGIKPMLPDDSALVSKINGFADIQTTANGSEYWNGRFFLYQLSWECFMKNPILGAGWGKGGGGHSFLLDYLAQTGLFGFVPFIALYIMIYKFVCRVMNKDLKWYYFTVILTYMLLLVSKGPGVIAQNHIVYLVVPLALVANKHDFYIASMRMRRLFGFPVQSLSFYWPNPMVAQ